MLKAALLTFPLVLFGPSIAPAQSPAVSAALQRLEGTLSVSFVPIFAGGKLSGCNLEFYAVMRDWTFRSGDYVKASGNFGLMRSKQVVSPVIKLVIHDMDRRTLQLSPSAPSRVYISSGLQTNADQVLTGNLSDTPGGLFVVFKTEQTFEMMIDGILSQRIELRYGRPGGNSDALLKLELDVTETDDNGVRQRSPAATDKVIECFSALVKEAERG